MQTQPNMRSACWLRLMRQPPAQAYSCIKTWVEVVDQPGPGEGMMMPPVPLTLYELDSTPGGLPHFCYTASYKALGGYRRVLVRPGPRERLCSAACCS